MERGMLRRIHRTCCPELLAGMGLVLLEICEDVHNISTEIIPDNIFLGYRG